jgi:hypothetical protein
MTPGTVMGLARLAGADFVSLTDHNSALNLPAAQTAAEAYGVKLIPGIEMNTAEEIHLLCYFPTVEKALEMGELIYAALPEYPYDPDIWGRQLVMDAEDNETGAVSKLLTAAASIGIYEAKRLCESLGGLAIPAHADRESFSLLSVMGFCPEDLDFPAFELRRPESYGELVSRGLLPPGREILCSSDAHRMADVASRIGQAADCQVLRRLMGI